MTETHERGGTEVSRSRGAEDRGAIPRLVAVAGPGAGRALAMSNTLATVGRHATNDLVLNDPLVSGVHLELRRVAGRVHVRDAGSTNGTFMSGQRVFEVELAPGAAITVGNTLLELDVDPIAVPTKASMSDSFGALVGASTVMHELFGLLERIASKPLSVLLQGETGTGKEEAARAIHARSARSDKPFVVIDATALPQPLVESLLFGHERGAFTGAERRSVGLFESAQGGTVFIDEIGELPAPSQAKFLRVLEQRQITRVGANAPIPVDVRVIAATHRDLRHEVETGRFREDLLFRLAQVWVLLAPLRDRVDDVPILCSKLLEAIAAPESAPRIDPAAMAHLQAQRWPGNVRELRNVLARAAALSVGGVIRREDVAGEGFGFRGTREERTVLALSGKFADAKELAVERFESAYLAALMRRCNGNLSLAAREADIARHHLRDLLRKRGLYGVAWNDEDP